MISLPGVHPFFGDHILIRLDGIDTPEIKGKCEREIRLAKEARNFLRGVMEQASTSRVIKAHRDKYFRIDATVLADSVDISELMINKGHAVRYDGGTETERLVWRFRRISSQSSLILGRLVLTTNPVGLWHATGTVSYRSLSV